MGRHQLGRYIEDFHGLHDNKKTIQKFIKRV